MCNKPVIVKLSQYSSLHNCITYFQWFTVLFLNYQWITVHFNKIVYLQTQIANMLLEPQWQTAGNFLHDLLWSKSLPAGSVVLYSLLHLYDSLGDQANWQLHPRNKKLIQQEQVDTIPDWPHQESPDKKKILIWKMIQDKTKIILANIMDMDSLCVEHILPVEIKLFEQNVAQLSLVNSWTTLAQSSLPRTL